MEPYDAEAIHIDFAQTRQPVEFKQETIKNIIFPKRQIENERSPPPEIPKKVRNLLVKYFKNKYLFR